MMELDNNISALFAGVNKVSVEITKILKQQGDAGFSTRVPALALAAAWQIYNPTAPCPQKISSADKQVVDQALANVGYGTALLNQYAGIVLSTYNNEASFPALQNEFYKVCANQNIQDPQIVNNLNAQMMQGIAEFMGVASRRLRVLGLQGGMMDGDAEDAENIARENWISVELAKLLSINNLLITGGPLGIITTEGLTANYPSIPTNFHDEITRRAQWISDYTANRMPAIVVPTEALMAYHPYFQSQRAIAPLATMVAVPSVSPREQEGSPLLATSAQPSRGWRARLFSCCCCGRRVVSGDEEALAPKQLSAAERICTRNTNASLRGQNGNPTISRTQTHEATRLQLLQRSGHQAPLPQSTMDVEDGQHSRCADCCLRMRAICALARIARCFTRGQNHNGYDDLDMVSPAPSASGLSLLAKQSRVARALGCCVATPGTIVRGVDRFHRNRLFTGTVIACLIGTWLGTLLGKFGPNFCEEVLDLMIQQGSSSVSLDCNDVYAKTRAGRMGAAFHESPTLSDSGEIIAPLSVASHGAITTMICGFLLIVYLLMFIGLRPRGAAAYTAPAAPAIPRTPSPTVVTSPDEETPNGSE